MHQQVLHLVMLRRVVLVEEVDEFKFKAALVRTRSMKMNAQNSRDTSMPF